jgi:hypothetical protein
MAAIKRSSVSRSTARRIKGGDEDRRILIACKVPEIAAAPEPSRH